MGVRYLSLAVAAALIPLVLGTEGGGDYTKYETQVHEKTVTFHDTKWSTTTIYVDKPTTYYSTYTTKETEYITLTETETEIQLVPTTETVYDTVIVTETEVVVSGVTNTETAISFATETAISLATETAVSLATETAEITSISVVVTTVFETIIPPAETIPITVSICPPSPTLEGLVLCPSRTAKPVKMDFPDNYVWGCPPGKVCKPKQVDCNFEQNIPEEGYYCDPAIGDECIDAPPLPDTPLEPPWTNYTCGNLLDPAYGYFDFDPRYFGLDFSIYNFGGQVAKPCETPEPEPPKPVEPPYSPEPVYSHTEWQEWSPPAESPAPAVSTEWQVWSPPDEASPPPVSTEWQVWSPPAETPSPYIPPKESEYYWPAPASKTWGDWSNTYGAWPHVTPRAVLARRQGEDIVPNICEDPCQACGRKAQQVGKVFDQLCPDDSDFKKYYTACDGCVADNKDSFPNGIPPLLSTITQWLDWCDSQPTATQLVPQSPAPVVESTATAVVTLTPIPSTPSPPASTPVAVTPPAETPSSAAAPPASEPVTPASSPTFAPPAESITLITSCNCVTITSTLSGPPASQISDGQVQAPTGPSTFTGGTSSLHVEGNWFLTLLLSLLALF